MPTDWKTAAVATRLINKYSYFNTHRPGTSVADGHTVLISGATGSVGAEILGLLGQLSSVKKVYVMVRDRGNQDRKARVRKALEERHLKVDESLYEAIPFDYRRADLGFPKEVHEILLNSLTVIIHAAWPVNFNRPLASYDDQFDGMHNLINLALKVRTARPAKFVFLSSTSVGCQEYPVLKESMVSSFKVVWRMGYAYSKYVAEHIVQRAYEETGIEASVVRTGQIIGDGRIGYWNVTDSVPLMFQASLSMGVLPQMPDPIGWLPVDIAAQAVLDIAGITCTGPFRDDSVVYNVYCIHSPHWDLFHDCLVNNGFDLPAIPFDQWLDRLIKDKSPGTAIPRRVVPYFNQLVGMFSTKKLPVVAVDKASACSRAFREYKADYFESGLIDKSFKFWMQKWTASQPRL